MKLKSTLLFLFAFCFISSQTYSQFKCGSDEARQRLIEENPAYKRNLEDMDRDIQRYIDAHPPEQSFTAGTAATLYYIPCVVHVIYDGVATVPSQYNPSAAQITGAIDYINKVYDGTWTGTGGPILGAGDLQIKFVLATKDPSNAATTGIDRIDGSGLAGYSSGGVNSSLATGASEISVKNLTRWDPAKYYNIWVVSKIDGCSGYFCGCACDAGFTAGYAYFPPANNTTANARDLDGTIMLASQLVSGEKTLPHELGHMLNLYHPFQGSTTPGPNTCPANASPTTQGDLCTDTDPITNPYLAPNVPFACRTGVNPCSGTAYTDNTEKNYMNYTNCYQLFTNDQKARMQASFTTTQRASLATSWANNQGAYPAPFVAPIPATAAPTSSLLATNIAGVLNVSLNGKIVYSLNATQEGGYLNNSTKWYDAFQLQPATSYTMNVTVITSNAAQLGVWIDYNNNGAFNNTSEQLYLNTNIASGTGTISIPFTTPAAAAWASNNFVRIRLVNDASTVFGVAPVSNASTTLDYGQAEDYAAYLTGGVVPVNMLSFTGKKAADAITLNWKTSQEINSDSYDIERSVNAAAYEVIGNVHAAGSATGANYTFTDNNIAKEGNYLYRLKMKDVDGTFTYSNVLSFKVAGVKQLIVTGNPFKDQINMILPYSTGNAAFKLTDAAGRIVYASNMQLSGSSTATLMLQSNSMSRGVYILEAVINGERFTQKVVKE